MCLLLFQGRYLHVLLIYLQCNVDLWVVAVSYVYFEKLILKVGTFFVSSKEHEFCTFICHLVLCYVSNIYFFLLSQKILNESIFNSYQNFKDIYGPEFLEY
jgi:hypothetical protein